jgi:hypothetical protein
MRDDLQRRENQQAGNSGVCMLAPLPAQLPLERFDGPLDGFPDQPAALIAMA